VEDDSMGFVKPSDEEADVRSQYAFEGLLVRSHDVDGDPSSAEGRGDLETDEARADDDHSLGRGSPGDDPSAVGEAAEVVKL
jgi:hypothetical protein